MATPFGTSTITALTRRYVQPEVADSFYDSNVLTYRWKAAAKVVEGGLWLEQPINTQRFNSGVRFTGFDVIPPVPQDTIVNAAWDWKNVAVPVTLDGTSIRKNNSPESVANLVSVQTDLARAELEDIVGQDLFNTGAYPKAIEGLRAAVDNGSVAATYGGLGSRTTTNSFWQPATGALDTTTATMTLPALQTVFQAAKSGSRRPTIGVTTDANYSRFWNLNQPQQRFPVGNSGARDEQLAAAGFDNLLFNNVPIVTDSHCPANHFFFLNEDYVLFVVHPDANFSMEDWLQPVNQDAMTCKLILMYALVIQNVKRQGLLNALAA